MNREIYFNREISWLAFNERVMQEAKNPEVPLLERLKFLAIYSSNLDEFFKVRVATLKRLINLKKKTKQELAEQPEDVLEQILIEVEKQQHEFNKIFKKHVLKQLNEQGIHFVNEKKLNKEQEEFITRYFQQKIKPLLKPVEVSFKTKTPFLKDNSIYFAIVLRKAEMAALKRYALLELPEGINRFIVLPEVNGEHYVMNVDDVIRFNLSDLFPGYDDRKAYAVRVLRDSELDIEDDVSESLLKKIIKSLKKREEGEPMRLSYDPDIPVSFLFLLSQRSDIVAEELVNASKYPDFADFMKFPDLGYDHLKYVRQQPLAHPDFERCKDYFELIGKRDRMLHVPYQRFDYLLHWLRQASKDDSVTSISITLYRVAKESKVVKLLIKAAKKGKKVTAIVELKARFDEASNIYWSKQLEEAGAKVLYSLPDSKVHCKMTLITRLEGEVKKEYAHLSTGNYNEDTATVYSDFGIFTKDERITREIKGIFQFFLGEDRPEAFKHLIVAPFNMRRKFYRLIDKEIANAGAGKPAYIIAKMNSLQDRGVIQKLYEASRHGVRIRLIVRGICCLVPGVKDLSEHVKITSIVDRYLEHSRIYIFANGGNEKIYAASADWMTRNLDRRVEIAFPVYDKQIQEQIRQVLELQLQDNVKARIIDEQLSNKFIANNKPAVRSQYATYEYFKKKASAITGRTSTKKKISA